MPLRVRTLASVAAVVIGAGVVAATQLPAIGAGGLLHPARRPVAGRPPASCREMRFRGEEDALEGWRCAASGPRGAALVYLHGIADNRSSAAGVVERFPAGRVDVLAS